jgi:2-phospho-L-lactate/phosphoenolpyruvate guanylyltransferase
MEADDLRSIYDAAPVSGAVLVPSADKRGTNAVLRSPAALFPLRFGNDSFMPHLASAIATNTSCVVLSLPRIALDVDNSQDLQRVALAPGNKPSQLMARQLGFAAGLIHGTYENVQSSSSATKP